MPFSVSAMYLSLRLADIVVISAVETQGAFVDDITFVYQNIYYCMNSYTFLFDNYQKGEIMIGHHTSLCQCNWYNLPQLYFVTPWELLCIPPIPLLFLWVFSCRCWSTTRHLEKCRNQLCCNMSTIGNLQQKGETKASNSKRPNKRAEIYY